MKAILAALIAILALSQLGYTQRTRADRIVLEGACLSGLGGVATGTGCTYAQAVMTGSVAPKGYEVAHAGATHFVELENVRSFKTVATPGDVLSTFTWRTWTLLGILLGALAVFYRETRGMIGMAFIRPSIGIKRISR